MSETAVVEDKPAAEEKPKREKKVVQPHPCLCRFYVVGDAKDQDVRFTTECEAETKSVFTQGHDAKLVSFLVGAESDGYSIWQRNADNETVVSWPGAVEAATAISEKLGEKAKKAVVNVKERTDARDAKKAEREKIKNEKLAEKAKAKAEREKATADRAAAKAKAKAEAPKAIAANVVEGSQEGDAAATQPTELAEGEKVVVIKIGRNEINATMSADGRTVSWRDSKDQYQERSADTVRILEGV